MTTWATGTLPIRTQIQHLLDDGTFETSGTLYSSLLPWANSIITEICHEINIRTHLTNDTSSMVFTTSDSFIALPTNFLKLSSRLTKVRQADTYIDIIGIEELNAFDPNHSDTTTVTYPSYVAIEGGNMYVYPLFAGTLILENYYRIPTAIVNDSDSPDIPEDTLRTDLIIAGVCGKYGFPHINETVQAELYYNRGTYPASGRFFELLELYRAHLGASASVWSNIGIDY